MWFRPWSQRNFEPLIIITLLRPYLLNLSILSKLGKAAPKNVSVYYLGVKWLLPKPHCITSALCHNHVQLLPLRWQRTIIRHKETEATGHHPKLSLMGFLLCPVGKWAPTSLETRLSRLTQPGVVVLVVFSFLFLLFFFVLGGRLVSKNYGIEAVLLK